MRSRFFRLALVNILSTVTVPLVGLVDTAMLGHLPDIRFLAGVALASLVFDFLYWTLGFLRMTTTGMTAQAFGRSDRDEVALVLQRSFAVALVLGAALLALQLPLREICFGLLSGEPGVELAGRDYFNARIWGAPAVLCSLVLMGWFLGREQSRHVLVMALVGNLGNVVLNYVFIIRLELAASGAGLASMISQYVMLAVGWAIYRRQRRPGAWRWSRVLDRKGLATMFRLNRDVLLRTLCLIGSFALFVNSSSILGTLWLASNSILLRLQSLASYFIDGAAMASESLAGIFRGQNDPGAIRRLFRLSLVTGLVLSVGFLALLLAGKRFVLELLTSHADVVQASSDYLPWLVPVLLFGSLAYMYDGLFLGLTEGRRLRNAMLISTFLVFVPLCWTALWMGSNHGLWASMALFMLARTLTLWAASRDVLASAGGNPSAG
jgi:MATE family multidrug resistance protein